MSCWFFAVARFAPSVLLELLKAGQAWKLNIALHVVFGKFRV
jgi:hypothetical protein